MSSDTRRSEAGITLVEILIGAVLTVVLAMMVVRTMGRMQGLQSANDFQARLHASSHRAMTTIVRDLKRSLYRTTVGAELPYVFDDGVATTPYAAHAHTPAQSEAVVGDPDFGPNREIVFILPQDADADGRPDLVMNSVVWSTDEISYTVITDPAGNALVRSVNNASRQVVARNLERVVFDTPASSGFAIPLASVRVRLFFRATDRHGVLYQYQTETLVRLQQENS